MYLPSTLKSILEIKEVKALSIFWTNRALNLDEEEEEEEEAAAAPLIPPILYK
jgi:hypothetical protein